MKNLLLTLSIFFLCFYQGRAQKQDTSRFLNLGVKLGVPYLFAVVNENPSGNYLASQVWGSLLANDLALSAQLEKTNGLSYGLELGYRQQAAAFANSKRHQVFQGASNGRFFSSSLYLAPSLLHNFRLKETVVLNVYGAVELHYTLSNSRESYAGNQYAFTQTAFFAQPKVGAEIRKQLNTAFWAAIFVEASHSFRPIATLTIQDQDGNTSNLGHFNGAGFNLGLRLSLCWACIN